MRADDIRKDQMRYKEIEPNGISPNSTALGHDQPLWLPLVFWRAQSARPTLGLFKPMVKVPQVP